MANGIYINGQASGQNLYAILSSLNVTSSDWSVNSFALTNVTGTQQYRGDLDGPIGGSDPAKYIFSIYKRLGSTPAPTDTWLKDQEVLWDGIKEVTALDVWQKANIIYDITQLTQRAVISGVFEVSGGSNGELVINRELTATSDALSIVGKMFFVIGEPVPLLITSVVSNGYDVDGRQTFTVEFDFPGTDGLDFDHSTALVFTDVFTAALNLKGTGFDPATMSLQAIAAKLLVHDTALDTLAAGLGPFNSYTSLNSVLGYLTYIAGAGGVPPQLIDDGTPTNLADVSNAVSGGASSPPNSLTHNQMVDIINAGGSVTIHDAQGDRVVNKIADLPA